MSFADRLNELRAKVEEVRLNVLVWGPGEGQHYAKRVKIREGLQASFRNADVLFSEELDLGEVIPGSRALSLPEQELWHLAACDVCVVLDTSKGAGEEIAYATGSLYAHKLLILTSEEYRDAASFPAALRGNQNQVFYSPEEYASCSLVDAVLARVRQVAFGGLLRLLL